MRAEHDGKQYEIRFKHQDNRFEQVKREDGKLVCGRARTAKEIRRLGGTASTTCSIFELTEAGLVPVVVASVRHNYSKDRLNWNHGRFYALERALGELEDGRLARALRKAYYQGVSWRPDGRDGFKLRQWFDYGAKREVRELIPCR